MSETYPTKGPYPVAVEESGKCVCGHGKSEHNVQATWAPLGCYRVVAIRFAGDMAGKICECIHYHQESK